ncbi:MAG: YicC family protein [Candidatus Sumerlaeaceae bacterium]|nr:YicC family protein [Candidatus Sumerlaeaceae bacterium]
MTGYGVGTDRADHGEFIVEIRSVNNRYLEVSVKLPKELIFLDPSVRSELRTIVARGKVDVNVRWIPSPQAPPLCEINVPLIEHYLSELRKIANTQFNFSADLSGLLSLPGVLVPTPLALQGLQLEASLRKAVRSAGQMFDQARRSEGAELSKALAQYLGSVEDCVESIARLKPELDQLMLSRLAENIRKLAEAVQVEPQPGRIEMELALAADKVDVTEEIVRLRSHIKAFRERLDAQESEPIGKSLDFLVQELHREITTLGNKAREPLVSPYVLRAKTELEKIREQVQNIE